MSEVLYDMSAVVPAVIQFFRNHPELPRVSEVWAPIAEFIESHELDASLSNIEFAYKAQRVEVEKALDQIPPDEWKTRVLIPEFKKRQSKQPKETNRKPIGVSWSQYIHSS
jgi:hypothetical protein